MLATAGCEGHDLAIQRVRAALDALGRGAVTVGDVLIATPEDALRHDFRGSPTITVDGTDLFPDGDRARGVACRRYRSAGAVASCPTEEEIRLALEQRLFEPRQRPPA